MADRLTVLRKGLALIGGSSLLPDLLSAESTTLQSDYIPAADPSIEPFVPGLNQPWDKRRVLHLMRRTGLNATPAKLAQLLGMSPEQAVDFVVDQALNHDGIPEPIWANNGGLPRDATAEERAAYQQMRNQWTAEYRNSLSRHILENGLHGKLTLFWHNHFVTEFNQYGNTPQFAYKYIRVIQDHLLGDFKQLTVAMGLTPAMLVYLNGNTNRRQAPNENYARELLELFTLGEGNDYTQHDIEELARAFTGYVIDPVTLTVNFVPNRFDSNPKTIFGKTANYNYYSANDLLFAERAPVIARHICRELYTFFVYPNAPESVINDLADVFLQNNLNLEPVIRALFKSRHFFDMELIGATVSSPIDFFGNTISMLQINLTPQELRNFYNYSGQSGQQLLQPPDVSGWPGHRTWLDTSTLPIRWNLSQISFNRYQAQTVAFAKLMPEPNNAYSLARSIAEHMIAVVLTDDEYTQLGDVLLGGAPYYEWNINNDGAASRIQALMSYILLMPEFQLN
jgi:uncharacterized protein (DUF1800 family)